MVEGPGCKVKGEKLHPRIKGQTVKGVAGNAVERVCSPVLVHKMQLNLNLTSNN